MINFKCEGHEADTKLVFFLNQLNMYAKVVIRCAGTGILVYYLRKYGKI